MQQNLYSKTRINKQELSSRNKRTTPNAVQKNTSSAITAIYSMIGIVAVFLVVVAALPTSITGEISLRQLFRGDLISIGECTTAKDSCPKEGFCSAKLAISETSKLKGIYRGDCITKYKPGHLCKRDFQCKSNECAGLSQAVASKFLSINIGACA